MKFIRAGGRGGELERDRMLENRYAFRANGLRSIALNSVQSVMEKIRLLSIYIGFHNMLY